MRITASSGVRVCGNLGTLPASIAVGTAGSPDLIPTPTPDPDDIEEPDTGGYAPLGSGLLMVAMMIVGRHRSWRRVAGAQAEVVTLTLAPLPSRTFCTTSRPVIQWLHRIVSRRFRR